MSVITEVETPRPRDGLLVKSLLHLYDLVQNDYFMALVHLSHIACPRTTVESQS